MRQFGSQAMYDWFSMAAGMLATEWRLHLMKLDAGAWVAAYNSGWPGELSTKEATFKGYAHAVLQNVTVQWDAPNSRVLLSADDVAFTYNSASAGDASNVVDGWVLNYQEPDPGIERFFVGEHFSLPYVFNANGHTQGFKVNVILVQAPYPV